MPTIRDIPGLGPSNGRPSPNVHADLTSLPLSPTEAFVLSRVDGHTSYADLFLLTGLGEDQTAEILRRLLSSRLILPPSGAVQDGPTASVSVRETPPHSIDARHSDLPRPVPGGRRKRAASLLEQLDDGSPVSAAELADAPDVDQVTRERLVRLHRRLAALDDYTILGLVAGAEAQDVRRAYYAASKEFHPDRYFGKSDGKARQMLADIFARCSQAFERLRNRA